MQVTEESSPWHSKHLHPTSAENLNKEIFKSLWEMDTGNLYSDKEGTGTLLSNPNLSILRIIYFSLRYLQNFLIFLLWFTFYLIIILLDIYLDYSIDMFIFLWLHTMQLYRKEFPNTQTESRSNKKVWFSINVCLRILLHRMFYLFSCLFSSWQGFMNIIFTS